MGKINPKYIPPATVKKKDTSRVLMSKNRVQVDSDDFGVVLLCAVRYAAGRQTYMPGLVQSFIRPLIPELNNKTLQLVERDLTQCHRDGRLGDLQIDAPGWIRFLTEVREEMQRRKIERLV